MSAPEPRYVANAGQAFTEAHIDGGENKTRCSIETGWTGAVHAMWVPVVLRPGDRVCAACLDPEGAAETQEALL